MLGIVTVIVLVKVACWVAIVDVVKVSEGFDSTYYLLFVEYVRLYDKSIEVIALEHYPVPESYTADVTVSESDTDEQLATVQTCTVPTN